MIKPLQPKWDNLTHQLNDVVALVAQLNHEQLHFKADASKWSIVQIIRHLYIAEANTNIYLRKKILAGGELQNTSIRTVFNFSLLRLVMYFGIKFKAPQIVHPESNASVILKDDEVLLMWKAERRAILDFLNNIDKKMASKLIFKHGIGMRLNLYQMLDWMYIHIARHERQIEKIVNGEDFPS